MASDDDENGRRGMKRRIALLRRKMKLNPGIMLLVYLLAGIMALVLLLLATIGPWQVQNMVSIGGCPDLLVEVGVEDGDRVLEFVRNGGGLRGYLYQKSRIPTSFCIDVFEVRSEYGESINLITESAKNEVVQIKYHPQAVVANFRGTATILVEPVDTASQSRIQIVDGKHIVYNWQKALSSKREQAKAAVFDLWGLIQRRRVARGGEIIVRISSSMGDAVTYLRTFLGDSRLCATISLIVLEVKDMPDVLNERGSYQPSSTAYYEELHVLANLLQQGGDCRCGVEILDHMDYIGPARVSAGIFYAMLAGAPTFLDRVQAASKSWMRAVPQGKVAVFTNKEFKVDSDIHRTVGRHIAAVSLPAWPETEKHLNAMSAWSHLVRTRASWDLFMKGNPLLEFLVLLDDDTYTFTDSLNAVLKECMDPKEMQWGGSTEKIRLDNGDGGIFGRSLREMHLNAGGENCTFPSEAPVEGVRKCQDVMCKHCPPIPQGGFVVLTRKLVENLRPFIEDCEKETQILCLRCGSQRLYMCIASKLKDVISVPLRGAYRHPWRREKHSESTEYHGYPISIHGMRSNTTYLHTGALEDDMEELFELSLKARRRASVRGGDPFVTIEDLHHKITCNGNGYFRSGVCYSSLENSGTWCRRDTYRWKP
eukprot:CAMPEP_0198731670 /NCGR_PEP_ID=MMETSP1475-20131203/31372_1 /TAXON_ID= ORGANISM="Unidentified sp., Strain CCMP1999" /NCGR_SAMPLE_ID=MMETSP1475 /ASSEMBLY_ACC=CAM_ASM_001111 /LENGTH=651 /DNA_ID=CAMNT_0044494665 /DNA_START=171 /DNA_END=2126 /DNA_ORIENTATION=+